MAFLRIDDYFSKEKRLMIPSQKTDQKNEKKKTQSLFSSNVRQPTGLKANRSLRDSMKGESEQIGSSLKNHRRSKGINFNLTYV